MFFFLYHFLHRWHSTWRFLQVPMNPFISCSSRDQTTSTRTEGDSWQNTRSLPTSFNQKCGSNPGIEFWSHRLSLSHTASPKISEFMLWNMCDWRRKRQTNRLKQDRVSGLCAVYSSGGCTFLRQEHMTEATGVWESGNNHCWVKLGCGSDGEVELNGVTGNQCVAFPSSDKRPWSHKHRAGLCSALLSLKGEISKIHWILIFSSTLMPFSGVYLGQKRQQRGKFFRLRV